MNPKALYTITVLTLLLSMLPGCQNTNVRVTKGDKQVGVAPRGTLYTTSAVTIVHVDKFARIVTLSNGQELDEFTFLEAQDSVGNNTAILKTRANRTNGLRTADILEGAPRINDRATVLEVETSTELRETYRDPVEG
jgi:UTP:GlnB (protein PII) uridylyltransferase